MRLLMFLAVVFFVIAFVVYVVPTTLLFGALGWVILGLLTWAVDALLGGWVVATPTRRRAVV